MNIKCINCIRETFSLYKKEQPNRSERQILIEAIKDASEAVMIEKGWSKCASHSYTYDWVNEVIVK